MIQLRRLFADRSASAAAEMALVLPILLVLMFGSFELGNYFLSEHVVDKAVRDAARYAARLPMADYDCTGPTVDSTAQQQIRNIARTGDPDGSTARLRDWADGNTAVTLTCNSDTTNSYVNGGIYADFPNGGEVPIVTVSATVPYNTFFGAFGLGASTLNLNARSQAAVIGA
jgi:Flp pilus assembly protein TadG